MNSYVKLDPAAIKQPYGAGRIPFKLSLTKDTRRRLNNAEIIELISNKDGKLVAKKGGSGSAFLELGVNFLLCITSHEVKLIEDEVVEMLHDLVSESSDRDIVANNLERIAQRLKEKEAVVSV